MNVQRSAGILLALTVMAAGSAVAQGRATRLVADSAGKFQIAFCNLKMGGKVGDGLKAFKTGLPPSPTRAADYWITGAVSAGDGFTVALTAASSYVTLNSSGRTPRQGRDAAGGHSTGSRAG